MNSSLNLSQVLQQVPVGGNGQFLTTAVMFGLIFLIFYFLIIRPQNKRQKETKRMLGQLKKGDKIQTIGGIRGSIVSVKEETIILKVDDSSNLELVRSAIANVINPDGKPQDKAAKKSSDKPEKAAKKSSDKSETADSKK